jgi:lactonase
MNRIVARILLPAILAVGCFATTQQAEAAEGLVYDAHVKSATPIPPSERNLQTVTADLWLKVFDKNNILEGAIFDTKGNLLFCDVSDRRVMRVTPEKKLSTFVTLENYSPGGLAFHKDGRLFIAALGEGYLQGGIFAVNPDGTGLKVVIAPETGYLPNDLVFDAKGGFYFTDFKGTATEPVGGVYYASPDFKTIKSVLPNLAMANGVALSPDGRTLWATEFCRNLLHRIDIADATTITPIGSAIPYHFVGPAPDSMRVDADGNVYVAVYGQARIMIFNKNGIPIGQVLLPGRDEGFNLRSTSLAMSPASNDLYAVTSDEADKHGSTIFHAKVFAKGLQPASAR